MTDEEILRDLARRVAALEEKRARVLAAEADVIEAARDLARLVRGGYSLQREGKVVYRLRHSRPDADDLAAFQRKKLESLALELFDELSESAA